MKSPPPVHVIATTALMALSVGGSGCGHEEEMRRAPADLLVPRALRRRRKERAADAQASDAAAPPLTEATKPVKLVTATPVA